MPLRPLAIAFVVACLAVAILLVVLLVRGVRSRRWIALLLLVPALACAALAVLQIYLLGLNVPHPVFNGPAPVSRTAAVFYSSPSCAPAGATLPTRVWPAMFAVQASTGKTLWQRTMQIQGYIIAITQDGGVAYVGSPSSGATQIFALKVATGALLWQRTLPGEPMWGGPLLIGDLLVLGENAVKSSSPTQSQIVAWRGADGQQIWSVDVGPYNVGSATPRLIPSPDPSVLYDLPNSSTIEARSIVDGRLLWANTQVSGAAFLPVVPGLDAIYAISTDGSVNAFSLASLSGQSGTPLWQFGHHDVYAATLAADTLYVTGYDTTDSLPQLSIVTALDAHTGSVRWAYTVPATHDESSDLVASPNAIVIMNSEGIYALRPADGTILWHGSPQTTSWWFCSFLTVIGSAVYYEAVQNLPVDTLLGPLPRPHPAQVYLSAVDATDGSLYWSVPVGPELTVPPRGL